MAQSEAPPLNIGLALLGSLLMFAGWVLAIVPAFQHIHRVALVVVVAIIGFGIVLVPTGLDLFMAPGPGQKRGLGTLLVSLVPAVALFLITVIVLPLGAFFRGIAIASEFAGMALYGWSRWTYRH
ncbi:MAG: hypothetical protein M3Z66_18445 [Chloroflexota bacterium]|nr:hypothetical protein [Chloroflexota bacterium]